MISIYAVMWNLFLYIVLILITSNHIIISLDYLCYFWLTFSYYCPTILFCHFALIYQIDCYIFCFSVALLFETQGFLCLCRCRIETRQHSIEQENWFMDDNSQIIKRTSRWCELCEWGIHRVYGMIWLDR